MEITHRIQDLIDEFESLKNWEDRYKAIIQKGRELSPMREEFKIDKNLIKGCQARVWLHGDLIQGKVHFYGDSDGAITKGIVALVLSIYSQTSPQEILQTKPDFIDKIRLKEHLSPSRGNGLMAMIKQIIFYAFTLKKQENQS